MNFSPGDIMAKKSAKVEAAKTTPATKSSKPRAQAKPKVTGAAHGETGSESATGADASRLIDQRISELADWRGETLAKVRALIQKAVPDVTEEWKWKGTPVWSKDGILCTGETYQKVVKLTFMKGASLPDPHGLFNSSLEGNARRAIDLHEGEKLNATAFKRLIQAAVEANQKKVKPARSTSRTMKSVEHQETGKSGVVLLSGGNPQIAKADGDAPVQAYIAAMPGWKSGLGKRIDQLIVKAVPDVKKAVRWNSPFYGVEGRGWFLSFHVLTRYVKVTFFNGIALDPVPPGGTPKSGEARWIDLYEDDELNEEEMTSWIKQAAQLPGWSP